MVLSALGALTLQSNATYTWKLNTRQATADLVNANGVTINSGAIFEIAAVANKRLPVGQVFLAINNIATAITGAFANLPDGRRSP